MVAILFPTNVDEPKHDNDYLLWAHARDFQQTHLSASKDAKLYGLTANKYFAKKIELYSIPRCISTTSGVNFLCLTAR